MNTHLYEEIRSIEDIINDKKPKKRITNNLQIEDEYTTLKNKEEKILNLLEDMHKMKDQDETTHYFTNAPLHVTIFKTFKTMIQIYNDLIKQDDIYKMVDILLNKKNIVYVGTTFVILSILLMFISL